MCDIVCLFLSVFELVRNPITPSSDRVLHRWAMVSGCGTTKSLRLARCGHVLQWDTDQSLNMRVHTHVKTLECFGTQRHHTTLSGALLHSFVILPSYACGGAHWDAQAKLRILSLCAGVIGKFRCRFLIALHRLGPLFNPRV